MPKSISHSKQTHLQHHLLPCQKHDHCKQISKHKYNKTKGKLTKILIILEYFNSNTNINTTQVFHSVHAPSQYKTLTHYKLYSTSGRLVH